MQRRSLYAKAFAELVVSFLMRSDRIFREELTSNLKLVLKLTIGGVGQCRCVFRLHGAEEVVPKLDVGNCVSGCLVQGHEDRFQAREGTRHVDKVFISRIGRLKLGDESVVRDMQASTR